MIQINNVRFYKNGLFVINENITNTILTLTFLLLPSVIIIAPASFILAPFYLQILLIAVLIVLAILIVIFAIMIIFKDPGYLPPKKLQQAISEEFVKLLRNKQQQLQITSVKKSGSAALKQSLYEDPKNILQNSKLCQYLNQIDDQQLQIKEKNNEINCIKCNECQFIKPIKCVHSQKTNLCVQQFDHFCKFLGCDIGIHNHFLYLVLVMLICIQQTVLLLYSFLIIVVSSVIIDQCPQVENTFMNNGLYICQRITEYHNYVNINVKLNWACLGISLIVFASSVYYNYIVFSLIRIQYQNFFKGKAFCVKEDDNKDIIYSFVNIKQQIKQLIFNSHQPSIMKLYLKNQYIIADIIKQQPLINDFNNLESVLINKKLLIYQYNGENIDTIITAKHCYQYALNQSKQLVKLSLEQVQHLKEAKPHFFKINPFGGKIKMCSDGC